MSNFLINLSQKGVATINLDESFLNLTIQYDSNTTFNDEGDILILTENDAETLIINLCIDENDILYTKTIQGTPYARKYLIKVIIDKSINDDGKYFVDCSATDIDVAKLKQDLTFDLTLTAENIVDLSSNPSSSNSTIERNGDTFYVQTNTIDYVLNQNYADWNTSQASLSVMYNETRVVTTAIPVTTPTGNGINCIINQANYPDYPRPTYTLVPYHNLSIQNTSFYVAQAKECYTATGGEVVRNRDKFGMILDLSNLDEKFVKVQLINFSILSSGIGGNTGATAIFGTANSGASTIHATSSFKIWKNDNSTRDNILMSIPLTNGATLSTPKTTTIQKFEFWINSEGWFIGDYNEQYKLNSSIDKTYDINGGLASITLSDSMNDLIVPVAFAVMNPAITNINQNATIIRFDTANLTTDIEFTLRLSTFGGITGRNIIIQKAPNIAVYTYTISQSLGLPLTDDIDVSVVNGVIKISPVIRYKNASYYDWTWNASSFLSVSSMMGFPSPSFAGTASAGSVLAQQRQALNVPPLNFTIVAQPETNILLDGVSFYTARANLTYYPSISSTTVSFISTQYTPRFIIDLTNITNVPIKIEMKNLTHTQGVAQGSTYAYPLTAGATTTNRPFVVANEISNKISNIFFISKLQLTWNQTTLAIYNSGSVLDFNFYATAKTQNFLQAIADSLLDVSKVAKNISLVYAVGNKKFLAVKNANANLNANVYFFQYLGDDYLNIHRIYDVKAVIGSLFTTSSDANKLVVNRVDLNVFSSIQASFIALRYSATSRNYTFTLRLAFRGKVSSFTLYADYYSQSATFPTTTKTTNFSTLASSNVNAWNVTIQVIDNTIQYVAGSITPVNFS